jgi:hypothetical protein
MQNDKQNLHNDKNKSEPSLKLDPKEVAKGRNPLTPEEQWEDDEKNGILDWDGN